MIGVIAINILEIIMRLLKISETTLWEAGGSVFLSAKALETPLGITIGFMSHIFVALIIGVVISYYIFFSGTNMAVWKGVGLSVIAVFLVLGIFFPMRHLATEMQNSPNDVLSAFIDHIVFGGLAGYTIAYLQNKK